MQPDQGIPKSNSRQETVGPNPNNRNDGYYKNIDILLNLNVHAVTPSILKKQLNIGDEEAKAIFEMLKEDQIIVQQAGGKKYHMVSDKKKLRRDIAVARALAGADPTVGQAVPPPPTIPTPPPTPSKKERKGGPKNIQEEVDNFIQDFGLESTVSEVFKNLTVEQKLKVIRDLKKRIVDIVKSEAETQYSEDFKNQSWIKKATSSITKDKNLINAEQKAFEGFKKSTEMKILLFEEMEILSKRIKYRKVGLWGHGTYAEKKNNPTETKPFTLYFEDGAGDSGEILLAKKDFNNKAHIFVSMPYEWGQEREHMFSGNKRKYDKAKSEYEKASKKLLEIMAKSETSKGEAQLELAQIRSQVQMDQLLNTHPEFEKDLSEFEKSAGGKKLVTSWLNTLTGKNWTNRGLSGAGFVARMGAKGVSYITGLSGVATLGTVATGAVIGGIRARIGATEELKRQQKEARRGKENMKGKTKADREGRVAMVDAVNLIKDLQKSIREIQTNDIDTFREKVEDEFRIKAHEGIVEGKGKQIKVYTPEEIRARRLSMLSVRIQHCQGKIEKGEVNFGESTESAINQFELIETLNAALVAEKMYSAEIKPEITQKINETLNVVSKSINKKVTEKQSSYKNKQMWKGVAIGTGAVTFGYTLRWAGEQLGWWGGNGGTGRSSTVEENSSGKAVVGDNLTQEELEKNVRPRLSPKIPENYDQLSEVGLPKAEDAEAETPNVETATPKEPETQNIEASTETAQLKPTTKPSSSETAPVASNERPVIGIKNEAEEELRKNLQKDFGEIKIGEASIKSEVESEPAISTPTNPPPSSNDEFGSAKIENSDRYDSEGNEIKPQNAVNQEDKIKTMKRSVLFGKGETPNILDEEKPEELKPQINPEITEEVGNTKPQTPILEYSTENKNIRIKDLRIKLDESYDGAEEGVENKKAEGIASPKEAKFFQDQLEHQKILQKQANFANFAKENPFKLNQGQLIETYNTYQNNLTGIYRSERGRIWQGVRGMKASQFLENKPRNKNKVLDYVITLRRESGVKPKTGFFGIGAEKVDDYVKRALQKLAQENKLEKIKGFFVESKPSEVAKGFNPLNSPIPKPEIPKGDGIIEIMRGQFTKEIALDKLDKEVLETIKTETERLAKESGNPETKYDAVEKMEQLFHNPIEYYKTLMTKLESKEGSYATPNQREAFVQIRAEFNRIIKNLEENQTKTVAKK